MHKLFGFVTVRSLSRSTFPPKIRFTLSPVRICTAVRERSTASFYISRYSSDFFAIASRGLEELTFSDADGLLFDPKSLRKVQKPAKYYFLDFARL